MTPAQLHDLHRTLCDEARALLLRKAHDYAGTGDALRTLRACAALGVDPRLGVLVRMSDKIGRLAALTRHAPRVDETVRDTVLDVMNYAALYLALTVDQAHEEDA